MSTIYLSAVFPVNPITTNKFMGLCAQLVANEKPERLYFLFGSPGGEVACGMAIYSFLRALPVKVTMHNIGSVDSIGNVIFAAADERKATPHATFLFHGVGMGIEKAQLHRTQIQELLTQLTADEKRIATILAERYGQSLAEFETFFTQGETKTADFARTKGIIQEVSEPIIPPDAKFGHLSLL
jgi:ATP-dependent protease ClpP protease subunit